MLGGTILFIEPTTIHSSFFANMPLLALHLVGVLLWAIVIGYVTLSKVMGSFRLRGNDIDLPNGAWRWSRSAGDVVSPSRPRSSTHCCPTPRPDLDDLSGVCVASYTAGLAADLPGGIVFDTAMLFGLEPYVDAPHIVGAIVVFRLYYYIIPLFLAGGLFAGNEVLLRGGSVVRALGMGKAASRVATPWSEPDFAVATATGLVALCGAMLLMLGVIAPGADYSWLDPEYADLAFRAGQFVPSLIGAGLVVMALALSHRVNLAWSLTIVLLLSGAGFAATQDSQLWVVVILVTCAVLLAPFRACFYRHASLLSGPFEGSTAISVMMLVICVLALVVARHKTILLSNNAWWAVVMSHEIPNSVRFAVALAVALAAVAIWLLVRPGRVRALPWDASAAQRLFMRCAIPPTHADGMVTGETDRAGLPFRRVGRPLLGLGDPTRRRRRQDIRGLAVARSRPAGGAGCGFLARRARAVEGIRRSRTDPAAVGQEWGDRSGRRGAGSDTAIPRMRADGI